MNESVTFQQQRDEFAIDCPVCGKKNIGEQNCPRCETDLLVFKRLVRASSCFVFAAEKCMSEMNFEMALEYAEKSWNVKKNMKAKKMAALACLAMEKYDESLRWFQRQEPLNIMK